MSFTLNTNFTTTPDGSSFLIYDTTGTGSTGYGAPNPVVSDFISDSVVITLPAVDFWPTGSSYTIDLFGDFPTTNTDLSQTIYGTELGMDGLVTTGVYDILRTIGDNDSPQNTYTYTSRYLFYPKVYQAVCELALTGTPLTEFNYMLWLINLSWSYGEQNKALYELQKLINLLAKYGKSNL